MDEPRTSRPFRERFLDGFDRSQLQTEVQRVKPKRRLSGFRKKAASWGLGATLALGGLGIPLKMGSFHQKAESTPPRPATPDTTTNIASDLNAASKIAQQVASGVQGAVSTVADTAVAAPAAIASTAADVATKSAEAA